MAIVEIRSARPALLIEDLSNDIESMRIDKNYSYCLKNKRYNIYPYRAKLEKVQAMLFALLAQGVDGSTRFNFLLW